jgi:hypothetical protein
MVVVKLGNAAVVPDTAACHETRVLGSAGLYRSESTIGLRTQPFIVGGGDDSLRAGIRAEDFCRMFASRDIDRRRKPVGDHRTWSGDGYGGHLVG